MKTIIVGGGIGGVASALLAAKRGDSVSLFEAHENLGGCASWFSRGSFCFDVGATTVSGVLSHQPLGRLTQHFAKAPALVLQDPGIVFHLSNGKRVSYFSNFEAWMAELELNFPHLSHRPFWRKIYEINNLAWDLLDSVKSFPFQRFGEILEVFSRPDLFKLYPHLLVNTEMMLKVHGLYQEDYLELINGILLISAQAHADKVPFLIGAMALAYPSQTYAPLGGMRGFFNSLEEECIASGVKIIKNSNVSKIHENKAYTGNQVIEFDQIILNLPYWNQALLFEGIEKKKVEKDTMDPKEAWGAFTLYFAISGNNHELYQQVHLNHPDVANYFISFSIPNDELRAPVGWQTVTISTHVTAHDWFELSPADYRQQKKSLMELILNDFKKRFSVQEIKFLIAGTPKTFERYTSRKFGYVGGLPFLYGMNPFSISSSETKLKNVYRVGDTIFPGQGLVGVVAGALSLDHRIKKTRF